MGLPPRRKDSSKENKRDIGLDIYGKEEKSAGNKLLPAEEKVGGNNLLPPKIDEIEKALSKLDKVLELKELDGLTQEKELNEFLKEKALELVKTQSKASLNLGKIFLEVEEKLGGDNQYNGVYTLWLELNGYNKMTALRHKRRYRLFVMAKTELGKSFIGSTSQNIINELASKDELQQKELIGVIDEGVTKIELFKLLEMQNKINELDYKKVEDTDIRSEYKLVDSMFDKISIMKLNDMEKINFEKDMKKVEKILKKYIKE
ncbi:MAG: hypothetical protein ACRCUA_01760 [Fusobacteriaceae bacterium]